MLGLYLNIPFCAAICNYCNFNRGLFDADLKTRYLDALVAEIGAAAQPREADTIYFGGGTPSLLEPPEVGRLIDACRRAFLVTPDCEITIEANPDSISTGRLEAYRRVGVNRLSVGVQSFQDVELQRLSRLHTADRARMAFAEARAAGFDNISLDLMMWLPEQPVDVWLRSVRAAVDLGPEHVSLYMLEVYPNAPLKEDMARARWSQAPDDDVAAMYVDAMEALERAGYAQYEISNVARPGRQSRHNVKYWDDGEWLGFGCGAHSTCGGRRWKNIAGTAEYVEMLVDGRSPAIDAHVQTADERLGDALFTGLRLTKGIDLDQIDARYGVDVWHRYGSDLTTFLEAELLILDGRQLRLTRRGMLLAHEIMAVFV
jgi:oxygen-independent coproporphyrinogen-3 oxidase